MARKGEGCGHIVARKPVMRCRDAAAIDPKFDRRKLELLRRAHGPAFEQASIGIAGLIDGGCIQAGAHNLIDGLKLTFAEGKVGNAGACYCKRAHGSK